MKVYLNGQFVEESEAKISIDDRGFLFADGVYEVTRVYRGRLFEWNRHLERLATSLAIIRIQDVDLPELDGAMQKLLALFQNEMERRNMSADGSAYIEVTRGSHPRSHRFPSPAVPPTILMWIRPTDAPAPDLVQRGVTTITVPDDRWAQVWIKSVGLLPNILAKQRAHEQGAYEAIYLRDGIVTECTSANLFIVKNDILRTAPVSNYILPGVTREVVLEIAQGLGIPIDLTPFGVDELYAADEVFLTGTLTEVLPITRIDGTIISNTAGPIALQLLKELHAKAGVLQTR